jgi:hypothetical protein
VRRLYSPWKLALPMISPVGAHFSVIFGSKALSCALMNEQIRERIRIRVNFFTAHSFATTGITKTEIFYSALFAEAIK